MTDATSKKSCGTCAWYCEQDLAGGFCEWEPEPWPAWYRRLLQDMNRWAVAPDDNRDCPVWKGKP